MLRGGRGVDYPSFDVKVLVGTYWSNDSGHATYLFFGFLPDPSQNSGSGMPPPFFIPH